MLKLLLTSCILHVLKYIETHAIQMLHITFNIFILKHTQLDASHLYLNVFVNFVTSFQLSTFAHELNHSFLYVLNLLFNNSILLSS
jgi:hypothetical protein